MYETKHTIEDHDDENSKMLKLYGNTEKRQKLIILWTCIYLSLL